MGEYGGVTAALAVLVVARGGKLAYAEAIGFQDREKKAPMKKAAKKAPAKKASPKKKKK